MKNVALRGLPERLHTQLAREAERNHRSLNGEILARLEASVSGAGVDPEALLQRVAERKARLALDGVDDALISELKGAGRA